MKKGTAESTVLADLEDMFRCDVKKYFELFPEPETKPKIKYLGQGLCRGSIKSSSSVSSQLPAPGCCVLACSTTTNNSNPLRVPENNENEDSLDVQGMGTLTMFCSPNGHHYALTCFHVGCANDESRLNAALNKVEDVLNIRKLLPNYVEYAKSQQYYFKEGNNSDDLPQYDNESILYGDDGSTCHALGGFDNYHFDNNCDILSIKINDNTEIDCKVADVACPNWIKLWKELHKRVFKSNGQNSVEVKKIGCSPAATHGHIVDSQFNYIHGGELLFQDAIVVKGCSGPFLKGGESGSLVFFHDFECEKQVFAYGVCEVDDLVLPVENEATSFIDDGSDADNQDDIEIIFQAEECHECLSNKTGPYYICLRLDTALENLGLENATCLNECGYNSN